MSGGHFDYDQYRIDRIAADVDQLIRTNDDETLNEWNEPKGKHYQPAVISRFREGLRALRIAAIYAQRIDWLVSGDDGEDSFIERLAEELEAMK